MLKASLSCSLAITCALLGACEVVADFDRAKLDERRTIGPTPLPRADGAVALVPDASRPDGALVGVEPDDAGGLDAAVDAEAQPPDASEVTDAAGLDADVEPGEVDPADPDATVPVVGGN